MRGHGFLRSPHEAACYPYIAFNFGGLNQKIAFNFSSTLPLFPIMVRP
jgi:hypothetical protein